MRFQGVTGSKVCGVGVEIHNLSGLSRQLEQMGKKQFQDRWLLQSNGRGQMTAEKQMVSNDRSRGAPTRGSADFPVSGFKFYSVLFQALSQTTKSDRGKVRQVLGQAPFRLTFVGLGNICSGMSLPARVLKVDNVSVQIHET